MTAIITSHPPTTQPQIGRLAGFGKTASTSHLRMLGAGEACSGIRASRPCWSVVRRRESSFCNRSLSGEQPSSVDLAGALATRYEINQLYDAAALRWREDVAFGVGSATAVPMHRYLARSLCLWLRRHVVRVTDHGGHHRLHSALGIRPFRVDNVVTQRI